MSACEQTAPHDPHFYATFMAGGKPGPVPVTTHACPGLPTDRPSAKEQP